MVFSTYEILLYQCTMIFHNYLNKNLKDLCIPNDSTYGVFFSWKHSYKPCTALYLPPELHTNWRNHCSWWPVQMIYCSLNFEMHALCEQCSVKIAIRKQSFKIQSPPFHRTMHYQARDTNKFAVPSPWKSYCLVTHECLTMIPLLVLIVCCPVVFLYKNP